MLPQALEVPEHASTSTAYIRYFLALTQAHLGDDAEARHQLQLANELAEAELASSPPWNRRLTLELLRGEAAAMVGGSEAEAEIQRDVRPPAPPVPTEFTGIGR